MITNMIIIMEKANQTNNNNKRRNTKIEQAKSMTSYLI